MTNYGHLSIDYELDYSISIETACDADSIYILTYIAILHVMIKTGSEGEAGRARASSLFYRLVYSYVAIVYSGTMQSSCTTFYRLAASYIQFIAIY